MAGRRLWFLCLAALLVSGPGAAGQDDAWPLAQFPGESKQTAQRLGQARKLAAEGKIVEALGEWQAILDSAGDDLVPQGPQHFVPARRLCHRALAALPPEALRQYRARAEPAARKLLDQAKAARDERLLRRIAEEAFCTRAGEEALDLLGDLALATGRFEEAERWWRMIVPLGAAQRAGDSLELTFPDPSLDPARVRAKQLIARLYARGAGPAWIRDLQAYRSKHETAEGSIGGRKGKYADLLLALAEKAGQPDALTGGSWTTFGGDAARSRVVPAPARFLDRLAETCRGGPDWRFSLEKRGPLKEEPSSPVKVFTPSEEARRLAFHPIFFGGQLLVAGARYVTAYDQRTGTASDWFDGASLPGWQEPRLRLPAPPDLRHTLTAADGLVFARLGEQDVRLLVEREPGKMERGNRRGESYLVCLNPAPDKDGSRLRWSVRASALKGGVFEGAPVANGGLAWAAATYLNGDLARTTIYCFTAASTGTPARRWSQEVVEATEPVKERRYRHHLLTLADDKIVYCSHSGAVVALDAKSGRRLWAFRYPSQPNKAGADAPPARDLAPCVYAAGRLFVAPQDSDHVFCLDPATGAAHWEREGLLVSLLLGVGQGRLIFTTSDGLRAVGIADGADSWAQPAVGRLATMGRGLLVGDVVLWPVAGGSADQIKVLALRQRDGQPADNLTLLHNVPAGNLVYAGGCLAVAGREILSVFVPPSFRLDERRQEAREHPESAAAWLALGRAEADTGLSAAARESLDQAERLAGPNSRLQGRWVRERARAALLELQLESVERLIREKRWDEAPAVLEQIAASECPVAARLTACKQAATLLEEAGQPARAAAVWQRILSTSELRGGQLSDDAGNPWSAAAFAAEQIGRLRAQHGDAVCREIEHEALALRESGGVDKAAVEQLADEFPNAAVTRQALFELARKEEKANRPEAAGRAYRRLLSRTAWEERAEVWIGLARAYERLPCPSASRSAWRRLGQAFGKQTLPSLDSTRPVSAFVSERLHALEQGGSGAEIKPAIGLPSTEAWQTRLGPLEQVLSLGQAGVRFFLTVDGNRLLARSRSDGKAGWTIDLPFAPTWAVLHGDLIVAAGAAGVGCIQATDGRLVWKMEAPRSPRSASTARADPLAEFRLADGRVFFLQNGRRLFALDVETGRPLWNVTAPGAALDLPSGPRFFPAYYAGADTVLVQTSLGRRWLLYAATGRLIQNAPAAKEAWTQPPLPLDDHRLCVVDGPRKVVALDARTGEECWTHQPRAVGSLSGEPAQLLAGRDALLLLVPTNLGYCLKRLDPATGKALWDNGGCPLGGRTVGVERLDVANWSLGSDAVYYVTGRILRAQALRDGRILWERPLQGPEGPWKTQRLSNRVLAHPAEARTARFQFRWLGAALQWEVIGRAADLGLSVACCDPETGRLVQRLNFRGALPTLRFGPEGGAVGRTARVEVSGSETFASVPGHAWARTTRNNK